MADDREVGVNDIQSSTYQYQPPQTTWRCFHCGGVVPNGCMHSCPAFVQAPVYPTIDFRVGKMECSKCDLSIYSGQEHTVEHGSVRGNDVTYFHAHCCPSCKAGS